VVATSRRSVTQSLINKKAATDAEDFMVTIPTSKLELDLLCDLTSTSKRHRGKPPKDTIPNPNKSFMVVPCCRFAMMVQIADIKPRDYD
jgi:hypothetical protein